MLKRSHPTASSFLVQKNENLLLFVPQTELGGIPSHFRAAPDPGTAHLRMHETMASVGRLQQRSE